MMRWFTKNAAFLWRSWEFIVENCVDNEHEDGGVGDDVLATAVLVGGALILDARDR